MVISTTCLPADFEKYFDYIFSFFCLQWVNHRMAFRNIFEMLKPDGEALLIFLPQCYSVQIFYLLSNTNKWCHHFKSVQGEILCEVSEENLQNQLLELAFSVLVCKIEDIKYKFDSVEQFKMNLRNEYMTDFVEKCCKLKYLNRTKKKVVSLLLSAGDSSYSKIEFAYKATYVIYIAFNFE